MLSIPKSEFRNPKWLFAAALLLSASPLFALDYPPLTPDPAAFKARREKFMAQLPPTSVAILRSAPMRTMTNDVEYVYRQDSDFYYLTGIAADDVTWSRGRTPPTESGTWPSSGRATRAARHGRECGSVRTRRRPPTGRTRRLP